MGHAIIMIIMDLWPMPFGVCDNISVYVLNQYHMDGANVIFVITKASNRQPPEFDKHDGFELE